MAATPSSLQGVDGAVGASPGLHHQQDTTWCFKGFNEFLYCVIRNQFLAWVFCNHFLGLFTGAVENGDGITSDIIIDGGNTFFQDTIRRNRELSAEGFNFIGTGVSGGEEGALKGPSIMPGGQKEAYELVAPILKQIDIGDTWLTVFSNRSNLLQNRSN